MDRGTKDGTTLESRNKNILDRIVTYQVPHSYFTHFYIVSIVSLVFWGFQIVTTGSAIRAIYDHKLPGRYSGSMSMEQVNLLWTLMLIHSSRRLYECIYVAKPSSSTMPLSHYLVGILYYLGAGMSIWIEAIGEQICCNGSGNGC